MPSLHQFRCFLAAVEHGSFTAAAADLGLAQPSMSEQIRLLERELRTRLFHRAGRGVVPTEAAAALRPHAERSLEAAEEGRRAVASVRSLETGTVRFGIFGTARLYLGAALVGDVLALHPGLRVELVGQNSAEVQDELRRGRVEAAMISLPVADPSLTARLVAREELVYVSRDPDRVAGPVSARRLTSASLVLPETSWRTTDSARVLVSRMVQEAGAGSLTTRVEVEDVETALELVGMGLVDSVLPVGVVNELAPRLAPDVGWTSLRPRVYESLGVVHRQDAVLSPASRLMVELATRRILEVVEPAGD